MQTISKLKPSPRPRIGLYSAGLHAYWAQFEGMRERLLCYNRFIEAKISQWADVYNLGLVDDETSGRAAGEWFNSHNVDLIFCHAATYFTSSTVLPVHQQCTAPVVILNLQPAVQMNYAKTSTGEWLAQCVACPIPEIANAFNRARIPCHIVNGLLGLEEQPNFAVSDECTAARPEAIKAWKEIEQWTRAAGVKRALRHTRMGFLGNNYSGMLDMYSDFTMLQAQLGLHVEILEMCDLQRYMDEVTPDQVQEKLSVISDFFRIEGDSPSDPRVRKPTPQQLEWSAKVACAQEKMVKAYDLDALSYYYHSSDGYPYEDLQSGFIVGHSLLTAAGIPCAGEGDIKTGVAMKICDILNTGGSFCEIVATDYVVGSIILGHDGPFHIKISDGKPVLRGMGVYHGKKGSGISVEANVVAGDVTLLGLTQTAEGNLRMIISEAEAIRHPILTIGNTQTHIRFKTDPDSYMDQWFRYAPTHHLAMSVGKNAALFEKVAQLLSAEYVIL